jgi:hypothetical protein
MRLAWKVSLFRASAQALIVPRPDRVHLSGGMLIFQARMRLRHKSMEKPWRPLDKMNLFRSRQYRKLNSF